MKGNTKEVALNANHITSIKQDFRSREGLIETILAYLALGVRSVYILKYLSKNNVINMIGYYILRPKWILLFRLKSLILF